MINVYEILMFFVEEKMYCINNIKKKLCIIFELILVKKNVWKYKLMIFRNVSDIIRLVF